MDQAVCRLRPRTSTREDVVFAVFVALVLVAAAGPASAETIQGTATSTSAVALIGVEVHAFDAATGADVAIGTTAAGGAYSITVPAGTYVVRTFNTAHYTNQLYKIGGNLQCVGLCTLGAGSPITVGPGAIVGGINFSLSIGGAIAGTITDELTGAAIAGLRVMVITPNNVFVEDVTTDAAGRYLTENGFPAGAYKIVTDDNTQGYINEGWPNAPCLVLSPLVNPFIISCPLFVTSINVTAGNTVTGRDLALRRGGQFAGAVTDTGGQALSNVEIDVLNAGGQLVSRTFTDASGAFLSGRGVPTGSYFVRTLNAAGYINRFNDGTICVGTCAVATLTSIGATEGLITSGVNFTLDVGGRIAGTIRDASTLAPLPGIDVQVVTATGTQLTTAVSDATGGYLSKDGLPSGSYFVRTFSTTTSTTGGYVHTLFRQVPCAAGCNATLGEGVAVAAGSTTGGIDFDLHPGGRVAGLIRDAGNGSPLPGTQLAILNANGTIVSTAVADVTGRYVTVAGLADGDYFVRALAGGTGYIGEVHPNVPCLGTVCQIADGTPVHVQASVTTPVDFDLALGGRFRGSIRDASGQAVTGASVTVLDAAGQTLFTGGPVDPTGLFITGAGLPDGFYYARTANAVGFINELYLDVPCHFGCRIADGTPIRVTPPGITNNIDIVLGLGGQVTGHVSAAVSGVPLANVTVSLFNATTQSTITGTTDSAGEYAVIGLPDGTYYARTTNSLGYINEAYPDIPCVNTCTNTTLGQPLVIQGGAVLASVDFGLTAGGRVSGTVTSADTGLPVAGVTVSVVDAAGATAATATTDLSGNYVTSAGILGGTYFVATSNGAGLVNELFNNVPCIGTCTFAVGNAILVAEGAINGGVNFALSTGGRVSGRVIRAGTTVGIQSVTVALFDASGRQVATGVTDADGKYVTGAGVTAGTYYARTTNTAGFIDQRFDGEPCPTGCPVSSGRPFAVSASGTTTGIDFALAAGGRITGVATDVATSQPLGGITAQIYDATGTLVTQATTNVFGVYVSGGGLAPGIYHLRTTNNIGYINSLDDGSNCIGTCAVTSSAGVQVNGTATTTGANFALSLGARVAGHVTGANGLPLRSVTVRVTDAAGNALSTGVTNAAGDYVTTAGLLAGDYYVRTTNAISYINQLYAQPTSLPCVGNCDVTAGTAVTLVLGQTRQNIDFALSPGAQIRGTVTTTGGSPLANVTVSIQTASGIQVASGVTGGGGAYVSGTGFPTGNYFAVTQNALGFVNQIYNGVPCLTSCSPAAVGTPIPVVEATVRLGIDFVLEPDTDPDGDGIAATVDTNPAASDDFSDVPLGGTTSGTISNRGSRTPLVSDVTPGGVKLQVVTAGIGAATFDVCPLGTAERVLLHAGGDSATVSCDPTTGSATFKALRATPTVELQDPPTGGGLIAFVTTGQTVTMGSPVLADPANTQSVHVAFVDASGAVQGGFDLDPGEAVDAHVAATGEITATVLTGAVTVTVRNDVVTLGSGESHAFPPADRVPPVLAIPAGLTAEATSPAGAVVVFAASAVDDVSGSVPVTCAPASGSQFPLGETTVSCAAVDVAGNSASGSFVVSVRDTIAPAVTPPPNQTALVTGLNGATVNYPAPAIVETGSGLASSACTPASGSLFPVGTTLVTCTATDRAGNVGTGTFSITVSYSICLLYDPDKAHTSGSTVSIKLQLCTVSGVNLSAPSIPLVAKGLVLVSPGGEVVLDVRNRATADNRFRFDPELGAGGGYVFRLKARGLAAGTYRLRFTAGADPAEHAAGFRVRQPRGPRDEELVVP